MIDAHTHIGKEEVALGILPFLDRHKIYSLACGSDLESCKFISQLAEKSKFILPTFGLHPWNASTCSVNEIQDYLETCTIIGEIGLDTLWCHVPMEQQEGVFIHQLDIAQRRGCPVLLHTKGAEAQVAHLIKEYTMPVLVHWYSCEDYLDLFMARDCYFTVGPDFATNRAVRELVKRVPLERLFVETDGVSALSWAFSRQTDLEDIPKALQGSMAYI
ncbi:MAG: TatD family hydrolase, partial [Anaerovorax sp.]